jgi:hypothetical protein
MPMRIAENGFYQFIGNNTYLDTTQEIRARPNQSIAIHTAIQNPCLNIIYYYYYGRNSCHHMYIYIKYV